MMHKKRSFVWLIVINNDGRGVGFDGVANLFRETALSTFDNRDPLTTRRWLYTMYDEGNQETASPTKTRADTKLHTRRIENLVQFLTSIRFVASIRSDVSRGLDLFHSAIGAPFSLEGFLGATQPRFGVGEGDIDVSTNTICVPAERSARIEYQRGQGMSPSVQVTLRVRVR